MISCEGVPSTYYCSDCRAKGIEHQIEKKPAGVTDGSSQWGAGVPTFKRHCTGCSISDGPWVSSDDVGGGW